jgi:rhodanese-related sulfurtransferase
MRGLPYLYVILTTASWSLIACSDDLGWTAVDRIIEAEYPEVVQISTDSLAALLAASVGSDGPLLLDVRSAEEYAVSHLDGAIHVDPEDTVLSFLDTLTTARPIIAYCSVGVRSSRMVRRLMKRGWTETANLEGSIFKWANEGRTVVREGMPVGAVHPYDAFWGRLLNDSLHSGG